MTSHKNDARWQTGLGHSHAWGEPSDQECVTANADLVLYMYIIKYVKQFSINITLKYAQTLSDTLTR